MTGFFTLFRLMPTKRKRVPITYAKFSRTAKRRYASKVMRTRRRRRGLTGARTYSYSKYGGVQGGNVVLSGGCTFTPATQLITSVGTSAVEMDVGMGFMFSDLPEAGTYQTLYDQYKITTIVLYVELINNPYSTNTLGGATANYANFFPRLWYVRDHDDNNGMTLAAIKEYSTARFKILQPNKRIKISLKPSFLMPCQGASTYVVAWPKDHWMDMANTSILHYGIKMAVDLANTPPNVGGEWVIKIDTKYYFTCKTNR